MPRGEHPNSRANLISNAERTPKEVKKNAKKGGVESGKTRRAKKAMREIAAGCTSEKELRELFELCKKRARYSDKSFELVLKILDMEPKTQIELSVPLDESIKEMEAYFGQDADIKTN